VPEADFGFARVNGAGIALTVHSGSGNRKSARSKDSGNLLHESRR
jgi:hypothetical protein